jgi:hypothetical protein
MWIRRLSELTAAACLALASAPAIAAPPASDDPLSDYRERFKQGMDRYQAGAYTEAIGYWEPIYGELGEQRGYRLAYNLGVAYEELGDATRAAERLQSFLTQVAAKRERGEAQPPLVEKEEADARQRIAALTAAKGRIHIDPGTPPVATQVDAMAPRLAAFIAWVNPGSHTVTFSPGTPDAQSRTVEVHPGELVDVVRPAATTATATALTPPLSAPSRAPTPTPSAAPASDGGYMRHETTHPFSPVLLYVAGGLTIVAGVASVPLEATAWSAHDRASRETPVSGTDASTFYTDRSWAYGAIGTAIGLGVVTAALATWYFAGTSDAEVFVSPGGVAGRF